MKISFFSVLALPAFFLGAVAAPSEVPETAVVEKRQVGDAYSIVESLYSEIQQYTGSINETAAGLNSDSSLVQNETAATSFISNIEAITSAINEAKSEIDDLSSGNSTGLLRRQTDTVLASLVENLLLEVSGALNNIVGTLGLTSLLGSLNPLVSSLSQLLLSLRDVVDNLLELVKDLLDGLLTGLSIGLAGLNL
ncbi:hypothetical protein KC343_g8498 [Hortaea werneckii]|uniref:Uncharacterized protein n=1 Tax=Hortaea werneckii TaxID=91943 RepID=A0A3M7GJ80_HORWE|nr:hypothetical protein KC352_g20272 [Hortaea werneckii]KAI7572146.1 hypothetical protein KC317_g1017 [Hortaea werneckii]KAI7610734.1 hypothetical protein KC346_g8614 [Hortaea werneckii]KAI7620019.1 hypothetical protein KC343_g8498 [Hortaea werneckii]KAI7661345.1 hypothetical protein KC319_g8430 [Hortaea werneckii]